MKDLVIFGTGGMGKEAVALIEAINRERKEFNFIGFSVDDVYYHENMLFMGYQVYKREWIIKHKDDLSCVCAIGYPKERRKVMIKLEEEGINFATLIHPSVSVADKGLIGRGSVIGTDCHISVDVKIGKGVFLNGPVVVIGHDCIIDDYVTCFPKAQISGGCIIGEAALIGSMVYIHEKKIVGKEAVIAPGSIVMRNVKEKAHVMGNPAKIVEI